MRRALLLLACCGKSAPEPPPAPPQKPVADAARTWPVAPGPTIPAALSLAWPPSLEAVQPFEAGVPFESAVVYSVVNPSSYPRLFVTGVDLATLEAAWGKLSRDHTGYAVWWNPQTRVRARFDVPHPTPSRGRGLELAPYAPTLDRVANLEELAIEGKLVVPPGDWDPLPLAVAIDGKRIRFVTRVDALPVDEYAVIVKLREIYGEPAVEGDAYSFGKGRVIVRHLDRPPALDITYVSP